MGKKSRAERRHHHHRMLEKVKDFSFYKYGIWDEEEKLRHQRKVAETRTPCSCDMCGNPRKHWKDKTMQEKRFDEKVRTDNEC
jgi:hypothetical protein